jgi:hypothetical protein
MTKVNDYWLAHNADPTGLDWTTGAYFAVTWQPRER